MGNILGEFSNKFIEVFFFNHYLIILFLQDFVLALIELYTRAAGFAGDVFGAVWDLVMFVVLRHRFFPHRQGSSNKYY